tara:strand:+ start:793 stop:1611 length:819 start_codon:yes stop_codon:yes gene_type:complete
MNKFKSIIKKVIPEKMFNNLYKYYLLFINPNKEISNYILSKKYIIKNSDEKLFFSLRMLGGATLGRAQTFYSKEPDTISWIKSFKKNSIFFDVGANIGIYSIFSAKIGHDVIAFEPESHNFLALNLNIFDNELKNKITAYPFSIDQNPSISKINIHKFRFGGSGHSFGRKNQFYNTSSKFEQGSMSITLDKFCEETKIYPNYIKIDVDGNELRIINGMTKLISLQKIKSILIELNLDFDEHKQIIKILEKFNYSLRKKEFIQTSNYIFDFMN